MAEITLYEKYGLRITVNGDLNRKEFEVLEHEIRSTVSSILKFRKFGRDEPSK